MVEKNPEAFRNISEVSTMLDIPTHVLRFWETRFNQLKPIKRNGGRRYYRPEDIILLKKIQDLLYQEGYTIKGAQQVLKGFAKPKQDAAVAELSSSAPSSSSASSPSSGPMKTGKTSNNSDQVARAVLLLKEAQSRLSRIS
jgi:DNA-binding transcriptional MerR regulator